ncbi:hypothetical protein LX32DRAFT_323792 [Colletotrichum zoysiae]|uniref:Uncharacterized protein n=1 Tax=Colletotrichum zoysiae TaxID=1216348 RepID=A0AAD9HMD0_9PEZI|nr:hypothetical protein LX32DRAFT_323792 [Colletotrichum zoysiae]
MDGWITDQTRPDQTKPDETTAVVMCCRLSFFLSFFLSSSCNLLRRECGVLRTYLIRQHRHTDQHSTPINTRTSTRTRTRTRCTDHPHPVRTQSTPTNPTYSPLPHRISPRSAASRQASRPFR